MTIQSTFGKNIRITIDGGSHEPEIGVTIQGAPKDLSIDMEELQQFLDRRAPGNSPFATARKEGDVPVKVSDDPLRFIIKNTDIRPGDYEKLRAVPRPGHADYTAWVKYGDELNMSGGGPFSARMTAPLCIAGGIAIQQLAVRGIRIGSHLASIADVYDEPFDPMMKELPAVTDPTFPTLSSDVAEAMKEEILAAKKDADSVGGIVETAVLNLPAGLGGPMYDGVESILSPILFGIPAVRGVEFGTGFAASFLRGSDHNDPFTYDGDQVKTTTNHHGGVLGGITSGMPLIVRTAFKPTPSIGKPQASVNLETRTDEILTVHGRHDPCVAVRAVPVCEAAIALGLWDLLS